MDGHQTCRVAENCINSRSCFLGDGPPRRVVRMTQLLGDVRRQKCSRMCLSWLN